MLAECGVDALHLFGGHGRTLSRATYEDTRVLEPISHGVSHPLCMVRIVHRISIVGAQIMARVAHARRQSGQLALHAETTVVGGNDDGHLPVPYPRPTLFPGIHCSPPRIKGQGEDVTVGRARFGRRRGARHPGALPGLGEKDWPRCRVTTQILSAAQVIDRVP